VRVKEIKRDSSLWWGTLMGLYWEHCSASEIGEA